MSRAVNANQPWTPAEHETLDQMWHSKASLQDMAMALGRSGSSIAAQLTQRGYVYFSQRTEGFHLVAPLWSLRHVQTIDKFMNQPEEP